MIYIALAVVITYVMLNKPATGGYHMEDKRDGYVCPMCRGG
jgi:hypothetical protein